MDPCCGLPPPFLALLPSRSDRRVGTRRRRSEAAGHGPGWLVGARTAVSSLRIRRESVSTNSRSVSAHSVQTAGAREPRGGRGGLIKEDQGQSAVARPALVFVTYLVSHDVGVHDLARARGALASRSRGSPRGRGVSGRAFGVGLLSVRVCGDRRVGPGCANCLFRTWRVLHRCRTPYGPTSASGERTAQVGSRRRNDHGKAAWCAEVVSAQHRVDRARKVSAGVERLPRVAILHHGTEARGPRCVVCE